MPRRCELGRQLPLRGPLKALEADIHHANAMDDVSFTEGGFSPVLIIVSRVLFICDWPLLRADAIQRNYGGACVQMRLSFSSLAPFFLYFIQWLDCGCCYALPSYLGLFHILICKVYADGDSSVSTCERRASLREFYAIIYPILQQLEGSLIERDLKGKGRCKDIVSRKRLEDWRKLGNKDMEREDECGICMETCTKMVLPNCSHAMCIKCYRDCIKDQNPAHSAEGASNEFAQETFGCLQITMMSLTLLH
ncbi:hypothetical protein ACP4OV_007028 [Aristida adscensionis]